MGKKLKTIVRTLKQSPDADLFLASTIALSFFAGLEGFAVISGIATLKQYVWGHSAYDRARGYINRYLDKGEEVNEEAIKKILVLPVPTLALDML